MNIYRPDEEFLLQLKEWSINNKFTFNPKDYGLCKIPSKRFFLGMKHTEEWKNTASRRMRQKNPSHDPNVRIKISKTKTGRSCPKPKDYVQPGSISVQTPLGIFSSYRKAAAAHNISAPTVKIWTNSGLNGFRHIN